MLMGLPLRAREYPETGQCRAEETYHTLNIPLLYVQIRSHEHRDRARCSIESAQIDCHRAREFATELLKEVAQVPLAAVATAGY